MHVNRYVCREGVLYEVQERDPEKLRMIPLHDPVKLAAELNEAEHKGRCAIRRSFRILMGLR